MKKNLFKLLFFLVLIIGLMVTIMNLSNRDKTIKIAFLGDSITQFGWEQEDGYVRRVVSGLYNEGFDFLPIASGIGGNTSKDMLERLDKDILSKNPQIMFFSGGLNDIWFNKGTLENYKQNISQILDKAKKSGVEVIILNLTLISEDVSTDMNKRIDEYNNYLAKIAKDRGLLLIDLNSEFKNTLKKIGKLGENVLTVDGVHMNNAGNKLMADKILLEFLKNYKKETLQDSYSIENNGV